jgi:predicted enzyme related to lactoylglutathione lyase
MGMIVFPFAFISSAYVPVASMPGWLQVFAKHQPLTYMVDSVRALTPRAARPAAARTSHFLLPHPRPDLDGSNHRHLTADRRRQISRLTSSTEAQPSKRKEIQTMTDPTPLITGVDFVCIPAQDFDAMTTFYGETLGLTFVKRYGSRPGAEYQAGNLTLAIMRTEDFGGTFSSNAMPIALQVADVAVARERLEAEGVRFVSDTFDSGVCWQAICLDPDGNPLSLHHRYAPKDERPASAG